MQTTADAVLAFWFGVPGAAGYGERRAEWFRKDGAFDAQIRTRFGACIERALAGELAHWSGTPLSALAQVLVLDQFTRNCDRDTPAAFAGDGRALSAAQAMVNAGQDLQLLPMQRTFVYLPFEHAESLALQDESVRLFGALASASPAGVEYLDFAYRHRAVIARFGRFPHRNELLGRASTPEEIAFLAEPGSRF